MYKYTVHVYQNIDEHTSLETSEERSISCSGLLGVLCSPHFLERSLGLKKSGCTLAPMTFIHMFFFFHSSTFPIFGNINDLFRMGTGCKLE